MSDITVKLTNIDGPSPPVYLCCTYDVNCGACPFIYTIRNICSLSYQMDSPVQIIPIPETQVNWTGVAQKNLEGEGPIALKIEGNQATVSIVWTINDEATTVVTGGRNTVGGAPFECVCNGVDACCNPILDGIHRAEHQVEWLLTAFQNRSINYRYTYNAGTFSDVACLLQKLSMTLEGRSPIIYRGEITLAIGDTVTVNE